MRSGFASPAMAPSSTTTFWTLAREGRSNMMSRRACSMMERSPRAPVRRSRARFAMAWRGRSRNSRVTPPLQPEEFLVLLLQRVLGLGEDLDQGAGVELVQHRHHRQAPDEFRDEAVL